MYDIWEYDCYEFYLYSNVNDVLMIASDDRKLYESTVHSMYRRILIYR